MNRSQLGQQAVRAALNVRSAAGADLVSPICAYDICDQMGISVKFISVNMEGIYVSNPKPRIFISALRPSPRRHFTCGHELGHHVFGHGAKLDHLVSSQNLDCYDTSPMEEFLANSFAGALLMPSLGLRRAFHLRGWSIEHATPFQILMIAAEFGVGYSTLIHHLLHNVKFITAATAKRLLRSSPQSVRSELTGYDTTHSLIPVDRYWQAKTIDMEVGSEVLLPSGCLPQNELLTPVTDSNLANHFRAKRPGIVRIVDLNDTWAIFARIMPFQFEGLVRYRHFERTDDE